MPSVYMTFVVVIVELPTKPLLVFSVPAPANISEMFRNKSSVLIQ
jgi:hypothetical protein